MEVLAAEASVSATNVTMTTTSETVIISSNPVAQERPAANYLIKAWAQFTTGANTTTYTPRIRRGTTTGGTLVNEANACTILATAGSNEQVTVWGYDSQADISQAQYSFTLSQASASGDGTVLQSGIEVTQLA